MRFDKHGIEVDGDCIWLLDAGGQRLCDLTEMQLGTVEKTDKIVR